MNNESKLLRKGNPIEKFIEAIEDFFPTVHQFYFIIYTPSPGVEQRVDYRLTSKTLLFGQKKWDFERKLIDRFDQPHFELDQLKHLLKHDSTEFQRLIQVTKGNVKNWIVSTKTSMRPEEAIGFVSLCSLPSGEKMHIPLMDFSCPPTKAYAHFVDSAMREIGLSKGIIVNSGKSLHYYGLELQSINEWQHFMSRSLLLSPFTDIRYIGHRLLSGYGILRIGGSKIKPSVPTIVQINQ